jgi:ribosomal protein S18 acetylase RimI-like enzyme
MKARIIDHTIHVLVLEQNSAIIGFVTFGASRDRDTDQQSVGEIHALYIEPKHWRKGHGSALVDAAIVSLQASGYSEATLWTLYKNERASRFYRALGFEADGATKIETRADGTELYEVRYRRSM